MKDHFKELAADWDVNNTRLINANKISGTIRANINLSKNIDIMDFGAGTGLLSEGIAPYVGSITAVDSSHEMLNGFREKEWPCKTECLEMDLTKEKLDKTFDGIISSMTMHHIDDVASLFGTFNNMLRNNGFIAFADLDKEDGTFHTRGNEGVYHLGFERSYIKEKLQAAGFIDIEFFTTHVIEKEVEGGVKKFPIFLVIAHKA